MRARGVILAAFLLAPVLSSAESGVLRAYVPNKEIMQDRPFWLIIEASGGTVDLQELPDCEGVVINTASPQQTTHLSIGGGVQRQELRVSFPAVAIRAGTITIPPIQARIDGRILQTEAIVLEAKPAPEGEKKESPVRAWVEATDVTVGQPFWVYIEATGIEIALPDTITAEGVEIDPVNVRRTVSNSFNHEGQQMIAKRGYLAVATREGAITIPPIDVKVTGRVVKTEAITLTARRATVAATPPAGERPSEAQLTQDDLVFVRMETDKTTAYQGEPILLTMQLWQIQNRRVNAGPWRGSLITGPTTEGFFTRDLEPVQYEAKKGPWAYDVTETRRLLYPTHPGTLRVGTWHWEGIALIDRQSVTQRDKLHYRFDQGPIDIVVRALPAAPAGFTGAVGSFEVSAEIGATVATQGVPFALTVRVQGAGNPDAVGDPLLPVLPWATAREPERRVELAAVANTLQPRMDKRFVFAVTPLQAGHAEIPPFPFVHFDSDKAAYQTTTLGPFALEVAGTDEGPARLLSSAEVPAAQRKVEILAEDIRPLMERPSALAPAKRLRGPLWFFVFAAPAGAYAGMRIIAGRRRRIAENRGWARSQRARASGLRRLRDVAEAPEPADALFRAMAAFVVDALNLEEGGLTSGDVRVELDRAGLPKDLADRTVQILRACERARYGSQRLSRDEVSALISAAESCMNSLDELTRGGMKT